MDAIEKATTHNDASILPLVWAAYTEGEWPSNNDEKPTATDWKAARRWARTWLRNNSQIRYAATEAWPRLDGMPTSTIRRLAAYAQRPDTTEWPTDEMPPPPDQTALDTLRMALCLRPQQWLT